MYFAYFDESGDSGQSGSRSYVLACALVKDSEWTNTLQGFVDFRRYLKRALGIPSRSEIKATQLLKGGGALRALKLGESIRQRIYRGFLRVPAKLGVKVFAVVIRKEKLQGAYLSEDPADRAWIFAMQRLERFAASNNEKIVIIHDEGRDKEIRALARAQRRIGRAGSHISGTLSVPFIQLLEDPVPRKSQDSYLIQLVDLCAYAAFRSVYPPPKTTVIEQGTWDELGDARLSVVSSRTSNGLVIWP